MLQFNYAKTQGEESLWKLPLCCNLWDLLYFDVFVCVLSVGGRL